MKRGPYYLLLTPFYILLVVILNIQSCGLDIEDPTPPSPPQWVQKSLPEEWPERGIDAHESGGIYLEWEPNVNNDILTYYIYRSRDRSGDYQVLFKQDIASINTLNYIDTEVEERVLYSYRLKAEDVSGNQSEYSDSISYSILPGISIARMHPNGIDQLLGPNRNLTWFYHNSIAMEDYTITVLSQTDILVLRDQFQPTNYLNGWESFQILDEIIFEPGSIYKWRIDNAAAYVSNCETSGSESLWAYFFYN
jgi:hypothetical protein